MARATWTTKDSSDLDLAIDAARPLTRDEESALRGVFEESDLPYAVDVVDMQTVSKTFRKIVERERVELSLGNMKDTMDHTTLAELAEILGGFAFKSGDFGDFGIPVVKISAIEPPLIDITKCEHILPEKASGIERFKIINGDMVMAMTGATTGKVGRYRHSLFAFINQRVAKISAKAGKSTDDFIYAILTQPGFDQIVLSQAHGSAQPNISSTDIGRITVPKFDYNIQADIGSFIRALDDKIELNRCMNETLESMARAIFKDWFVDFGPTRAKAEGRAPYLAPDLWSLFPERLDDEGKPEGWSYVTFEQLVDAKQGKYLAKEDMSDIKSAEFLHPVWGGNGILGYSHKYTYSEPVTLITCRGSNCGLIKLTEYSACVSNNSFACLPKFGSTFFINIYFKMDTFDGCISGSAQPQITYTALKNRIMQFPIHRDICESASAVIDPLFDKILRNNAETSQLAQTRDYLLPKLMSGEIRIREAEKLVATAV
ncbi:MAG: restriction endonuclease subunit S [Acidocella sp.]|nr:restriction endonuclease subunit S [Acidocella sp.]